MSKINTKGVETYLQLGTATATVVVPTAISKATPAVVTVASVSGIVAGSVVLMADTGFSELDGKVFAVGTVDGTAKTFQLLGSSVASSSTSTLSGSPKANVYADAAFVKVCLSQMDIGADSVNNIDTGTYCDPASQVPGKSTPGSLTLGGYADTADTGLTEIQNACEDQQERLFKIKLPGTGNGYLVGKVSLAGWAPSVPLEGVVSWTCSGTQAVKIRWAH